MATILSWFRGKRRFAQGAFMVGAAVKLAPFLVVETHAQQTQRVNVSQIGGQTAVNVPWICDNSTGVLSTVINIGSTQAQVVAGSTQSIYVCGFNFTTGDSSAAVKFVQGTSTDCITGQADKTGAYNLSSKSGIVVANGGAVQFKTSSANSLCIDTTSTGISGMLTYISST